MGRKRFPMKRKAFSKVGNLLDHLHWIPVFLQGPVMFTIQMTNSERDKIMVISCYINGCIYIYNQMFI